MSFRPLFSRDRLWASLLVLALVALGLVAFWLMISRPIGPGTVILGAVTLLALAFALLFIYRLWALRSLDYWVQRDAIRIHWHGEEAVVPLDHVLRVERGEGLSLNPNWLHWPEQWIGYDADARILAYASQPPAHSLAIVTDEETYLISPDDPDAFITAFEERRDFGPARKLKPVIYLASWRQHWLLHDRTAQLLMFGGLALGLILLAYVTWHYPQLPDTIALHFDLDGNPDLLSPRRSIFLIPSIALLIGFLNAAIGYAFYAYRRFIAYLLWSASVLIQLMGVYIAIRLINLAVG